MFQSKFGHKVCKTKALFSSFSQSLDRQDQERLDGDWWYQIEQEQFYPRARLHFVQSISGFFTQDKNTKSRTGRLQLMNELVRPGLTFSGKASQSFFKGQITTKLKLKFTN